MQEYMGIIKIFGGTFAPVGWMFCDGTLLPVNEYENLYRLLGTTYGGDGVSTFALPDLRSRIPLGAGQGNGLPLIGPGKQGGEEQHTLTIIEIPVHNHIGLVSSQNATLEVASQGDLMAVPGTDASGSFVATNGFNAAMPNVTLNGATVSNTGANMPHENRQPFLAVNYLICVDGVFPPEG
ncbi:MAG: microcystin-dependent protein [Crocinitomicaceae bacterium]|jgi:microcystin-dependent protein|nr:microcystin-dependent protein [Crocinitomicaceae bacterium]